ncbi:MAG: efflux RND transporter permease subunit [Gammaproteobacteria bacterium]|nr:efflux RND transporter permease subunit [Gammaproteobacteria bacterium]
MSISQPFIERPIATSLLMVAVVLLGLFGYRELAVSALPAVDFPTIQVTTEYPGASPDVIATLVTTPLERQFGEIAGLTAMTSDSSFGVSAITLQFDLSRNIDDAAQDVQSAINVARGTLPNNLPYPPVYNKVNPADAPILTLAITSDSLPLNRINDLADTVLAQKLSQVSGVGLVTIEGNQKPAVRVQVNPTAIAALGLSLEDIRTALTQANVNQPKGNFNGPSQSFAIAANDQIGSADEYRSVIVAYNNGAPVRLADIARVYDGVEDDQVAAWADGKPAILLDVQRQPGANILQTVDNIKRLLPELTATLPAAMHVAILADRTQTIRASVTDVQGTLLLTVVLVVLVMFLFLRKLWATVIPSISLPLSLIGTFGVMALAGFSLDNLSLMALTIATGFVVDDAIVMIENIVRFIEAGDPPLLAAQKGAKQIGFTVVSLTVSLVAVFIPLLLMQGLVGRLFREFSLVLTIAVVISALVSLTLTPMMCSRLLRPEGQQSAHSGWMAWSEALFERGLAVYERSLHWVLRHRVTTLLVALATLVLTLLLYAVVPKGLLPQQDTGLVIGISEAPQSISFPAMAARSQALAAAVRRDPDVQSVAAFVGAGTVNPTLNQGRLTIVLKPKAQRHDDLDTTMARIRRQAQAVQGISLHLQPAQDLQVDSRLSRTQYRYVLQDIDADELTRWTPQLVAALQKLPQLTDVSSDQQARGLQLQLTIDRDAASRLNVPVQAIDDTLYDAFGQRQVTTIYTQLNQYRVILEVPPGFRASPEALDKLYVKSNDATPQTINPGTANPNAGSQQSTQINPTPAGMVPLSAVARARVVTGPLVITHQAELPATTVSFDLTPGYALSDALPAIEKAETVLGLPASIQARFAGLAAQFQDSAASEPLLLLAAVLVIYIVLGVLYESYIHPLTILSTLPSAGVGALLALLLTGRELTIVSLVGIVLLIGIVKKNAIMMIDFALDAQRNQGLPPQQAIVQACLLRFRPIMMTTMAALLGALPLALGSGVGSELRQPLGIAIVGGLLLSQLLTLYTTPVIYLYLDRFAHRRRIGPQPADARA